MDLIGYIAAFLTTASFLPQVIKTVTTKDTSGISLVMYSGFTLGVSFWLVYGILLANTVIVVAYIITLSFAGIVLAIKVRNFLKGER